MTEFDEVRATVQALQGTATLLQGAMDRLGAIEQERRQAEQALRSVTTQVDLVRAEQTGVLAEFDRLVQGALARRAALLAEITDLEQRRDGLIITGAPPESAATDRTNPFNSVPVVPLPAVSAEPERASVQENFGPVVPSLAESPVSQQAPVVENLAPVVPLPATRGEPAPQHAEDTGRYIPGPVVPLPAMSTDPVARQPEREARAETELVEKTLGPVVPLPAGSPILARAPRRSLGGLRAITTALLAALLLGMAILLTPLTQAIGGLQLLAVMSGSMEPTIHVGGIVGVLPAPSQSLQVGDVITFANQSSPDVLVTHRIVGIDTEGGQELLTTRGDANNAVDAVSVPAGRAVGRVLFTLPWLGYAMVWLASPLAKIAILAVCVLGLVLPSLKRSPQREKSQRDPTYASLEREIAGLLPQ